MATSSPMMQQFEDAKRAHPDTVLLFRMGDFYETFHDDAKTAARVLGLALTSREKGENAIAMAGFPYHQLDSYLGKLVAAGHRVAICDQVESPQQAKGLVRREVTRVVSRGTLTDDALLDPRESNFLAAVVAEEPAGLAWVELSTGRFQAAVVPAGRLADELARIAPAECLIAEDTEPSVTRATFSSQWTERPPWTFNFGSASELLLRHFGTKTLDGYGFDAETDRPAIRAAGAVLAYLEETQKASLAHIDRLIPFDVGKSVEIDRATRRSLELTRTIRDGSRETSLLGVMDRTMTAMGSRLLTDWMANPLGEVEPIERRLDAVAELVADAPLGEALSEALRGIYDLERLMARVTTGRASPRDLSFVCRTLRALPAIKAKLTARQSERLTALEDRLDLCAELRAALDAALEDDCPLTSRDGGIIRRGYHEELDAVSELARGGKRWIAEYQARESERTGIANLKVGFNKVFGYYIEVTHAHRDVIPDDYIRKQTIKSAERYITPELKEHEEKILTADERSKQLEYDLFVELREQTAAAIGRLQVTGRVLAEIDVLVALAALARRHEYCRPTVSEAPVTKIVDGRHPVLDVTEPAGTFVPNDTLMSPAEGNILLITGPNMAGKSTYIRQVALLTIMAQMGSFVPARSAQIGLADRIFARVGASDELSRGMSTFMVEMTETARILNSATGRSLVVLDEIGRGTSTYDGLSLAWAVVEHLHDQLGCRTLFATHYHELTDLARELAGVRNLNVEVREWEDDVVFLHKIIDGAADKSYGIHVARLAGVPRPVIQRAKTILSELEDEHLDAEGRAKIGRHYQHQHGDRQLSLFGPTDHPLLETIRGVDVDALTPLDALVQIKKWQDELGGDR
ncbi:MAG: DNA mismatch repair protein MutS [Planctomycetales bacterium]|nr:DNA mismatch repair protein MutS [Planctomycetales bacterium]